MIDYKTLTFERYRDDNHLPTCAINFDKGHICKFYGTQNYGTLELCLFHGKQILERRDSWRGTLIPTKNCPLWKDS